MTHVYLLADEGLPDASTLENRLKQLAGECYRIEAVPDITMLQAKLREKRQAVVLFSAPSDRIMPLLWQCRHSLAPVAGLAVVDEAACGEIDLLEADCHFLRKPYDDFALLGQLTAAARQAELLATLADSAQLDEVTNLFNRRYFIQRMNEEISLSKRHLSPVCCVIFGIGFYQIYLDSYGYDFIHSLLQFVAERIGSQVRLEDIVARISDDEIAVLLPHSTEKGAKTFTNRLVLELNTSFFKHNEHVEELSICAGVAGFPLADDTIGDADTVLRYARHALHQARCADADHVKVQLFSEIKPVI